MAFTEQYNNTSSEFINKLRNLENKNNLMAENLLAVSQNTLEEYKRVNKEIELINKDIKCLKDELFGLKQAIKDFLGEIDFFAKKTDIKVLEKYINLWNPLEFVREEELEKIIDEKIKKLKKGGKAGRRKRVKRRKNK